MKTVTRRDLNQYSGRILDAVLATGEPVEVTTRGKQSVLISRKPTSESTFQQWLRLGLVKPGSGRLSDVPQATGYTPEQIEELLAAVREDH